MKKVYCIIFDYDGYEEQVEEIHEKEKTQSSDWLQSLMNADMIIFQFLCVIMACLL